MSETNRCPKGHEWAISTVPDVGATVDTDCPVCSSFSGELPPPPVAPAPRPLPRVDGYDILNELGRGGMGVVYKARQTSLNRVVALKMIRDSVLAGPEEVARFRTEAEAVAALQHPNIVQIFEVGETQGRPYFALEYLDEASLDRKLAGRTLPPREAARLVEVLSHAVHCAHEHGIVHRDLKPANVLLARSDRPEALVLAGSADEAAGRYEPKVSDFGLAKRLDAGAGPTPTDAILGTPAYMAPEQAGGKSRRVGPPVDIYALGAILYECLIGRPPFLADTPLDTVLLVLSADPVPPTRLQPKVPRDLENICLKCLQKEPSRRYATALALADDLRRFLDGHKPEAGPPLGPLGRVARWGKRNPVVAGLAVAVFVVLAAGLAGVSWKWREAVFEQQQKELALQNVTAEKNRANAEKEQKEEALVDATEARHDAERKKGEADAATIRETEAKQKAETAADQTRSALAKAQHTAYLRSVALADREWQANHFERAEQLLDDSPPAERGWEWYFLKQRCHLEQRALKGHAGNVLDVVYSPDGERLASAGADGTVRIWNVQNGAAVAVLRGHTADVWSVAFSFDGKHLASGSKDNTIRVWDTADWQREPRVLRGHTADVRRVVFSPAGRLASGGFDKTVLLWNLDAKAEAKPAVLRVEDSVLSLVFNADGDRLAACDYRMVFRGEETKLIGDVTIWDIPELGKPKKLRDLKLTSVPIQSLAFSPDGKWLALGDVTSQLKVWNTETDDIVLTLGMHQSPLMSVAWSSDGKYVATAGDDGTTKLWHVAWLDEVPWEKTPDKRKLSQLWENLRVLMGPEMFTLRGHPGGVWAVTFRPDAGQIATAGRDGVIRLWDGAGPSEAEYLPARESGIPWALALSPDGRRLAWVNQDFLKSRGRLTVYDLKEKKNLFSLEGHSCAAFSPDGKWLASAAGPLFGVGEIVLWDAATGKPRTWRDADGKEFRSLRGHPRSLTSLVFSPNGKWLVSAGGGVSLDNFSGLSTAQQPGEVRVWDLESGQCLTTVGSNPVAPATGVPPAGTAPLGGGPLATAVLMAALIDRAGHWEAITAVAFSPDGQWLVTAGRDGLVKVWRTGDWQLERTLIGHTQDVQALAFSHDGRFLATGGRDNEVRVWTLDRWREVRVFRGHTGQVYAVSFTPDDRRLASGGADANKGQVKLWDLDTGQELLTLRAEGGPVSSLAFGPKDHRLFVTGLYAVQVWGGEAAAPRPESAREPSLAPLPR